MFFLDITIAYTGIALLSLIGLILNLVIFVANCSEWKKRKSLQLSDQIYTFLSLVNIALQCALTWKSTLFLVHPPILYSEDLIKVLYGLLNFLFYYTIWINSMLCVHYVTSIASFNYSFFVWLKINFSANLPKLMLVSAVGYLFLCILSIWNASVKCQPVLYGNTTNCSTSNTIIIDVNLCYHLVTAMLGCFLPFIISIFCLGHTLISLLQHVQRLKENNLGFSDRILQTHIRAARTMVLLLILYISYCAAQVFSLIYKYTSTTNLLLRCYLALLLPTIHSFVVIQANSRLRNMFRRRRHIEE